MVLTDNFVKNFDFSGKTALITGGAKGIGKAIAKMFAQFSSNVILFDIDEEAGKGAVEEIKKEFAVSAEFRKVDLSDSADIRLNIREVLSSHSIEILVNNAGIGILEPAISCSEKLWDLHFAINTKAALILSQEVGKTMIERGYGKIVNMASQAGLISLENHVAYSATKAALISITKSLAFEWGPLGVSVNAVSPTIVLTELGKMNWEGPHGDEMKKKIPNRRFAVPEEVAYLVVFLASDAAAMINGENVMIDGGYTIQ